MNTIYHDSSLNRRRMNIIRHIRTLFTCCHHTCGNPLLNSYVPGIVSVPGFSEAIEEATQESLEQK